MPLAIDYRPKTLKEIAGNETTVKTLELVLSRKKEDIQHSFLLTGPSGCGKTTIGRIICDRLGCKGSDYYEIDSAQFRGIDTIREIRSQVVFRPMESEARVWLIDECHQLSKDAQNGLLKVLEDTPSHVYFILATTDPDKLLPTIKGRCAQFDVTPLDTDEMQDFLSSVCRSERKRVAADVLRIIARDSFGSPRNALQILDKVIDLSPEDMKEAAEKVAEKENQVIDLCRALIKKEPWSVIAGILKGLEKEDAESVRRAVVSYARQVGLGEKDPSLSFLIASSFSKPTYNNGHGDLFCYAYDALYG